MAFKLTNPEGIFAGIAALNLSKDSWRVQFDGGHDFHPVVDYGHGAAGTVVWLRFTVSQNGANVVIEGEWDLSSNVQTIKTGPGAAALQVMQSPPFNGHPFIEPGVDVRRSAPDCRPVDGASGSHVWLRYGVAAGNRTREYRFQAPVRVDLGKLGEILKALGIISPAHV